jgi:ABC-type transporter Mla subunit MlaD
LPTSPRADTEARDVGLFGDIVDTVEDAAGAVGDAVTDAVDDAVDAVEDAVDAVGDAAEEAVDALGDLAEDALDALGELAEDALETAEDVYDAFEHLAEEAVEGAVELVEDGWNTIADAAEDASEAVEDAAESAWEAIAEAAEDAWEEIDNAVEDLSEYMQDAMESAYEGALAAAEHVADAAASAYETALDAVERTLTWFGDLIKDIAYAIAMLGACLAGIVVHTLAEADNILLNFWKLPKTLPSRIRSDAAPIFPQVPLDRVLYIENATLSANHFKSGTQAMTFSEVEIAGINFAYMIYVRDTIDDTVLADRGLMIHELTHVDQYRKFRFEDAFACAYGIGFASAGFSYRDNPLEAEAFAVQDAYVNP